DRNVTGVQTCALPICRRWNLNVTVIDEFPKPGGRLLGQLHQEPDAEWWNGIEETKKLLEHASSLYTDIQCGISSHHIEKTANGRSEERRVGKECRERR